MQVSDGFDIPFRGGSHAGILARVGFLSDRNLHLLCSIGLGGDLCAAVVVHL